MHYFDYNATAPLLPVARDAWLEANANCRYNASSPYRAAARVRCHLENSRTQLAELLGCDPKDLIFNSGATEANNAIFCALARHYPAPARVLLSPIEHPCVMAAAQAYFGDRIDYLPVSAEGRVEIDTLEKLLSDPNIILVSIMAANNETGVIQPWAEALEICRKQGRWFHCDAAQWLGKRPTAGLGNCDFLTGSAHKFGGPQGVGFLRVPPTFSGFSSLLGGEQEGGRRAGTEDYPSISAMVTALAWIEANSLPGLQKQTLWHKAFEDRLCESIPALRIIGRSHERLYNTTMAIMPEHLNMRWVLQMDKRGFQISNGSACATGKTGPSPVLRALGISDEEALRAIRISSGWQTTAEEWSLLTDALKAVEQELHTSPELT